MDSFVSQLVRQQRNEKIKSWGMRAKMKVSADDVERKRREARARRERALDGRLITTLVAKANDRGSIVPMTTTNRLVPGKPTADEGKDALELALEAHRYPISAHNGIKTDKEMVAFRSATPRQRLYVKHVPVRA